MTPLLGLLLLVPKTRQALYPLGLHLLLKLILQLLEFIIFRNLLILVFRIRGVRKPLRFRHNLVDLDLVTESDGLLDAWQLHSTPNLVQAHFYGVNGFLGGLLGIV